MLLRLHTQNPTPTSRPSFVGENSLSSFFSVWISNHSNSVHLLILILVWIRVYLQEASSDRPGQLVGDCLGPQHHSIPPPPQGPPDRYPRWGGPYSVSSQGPVEEPVQAWVEVIDVYISLPYYHSLFHNFSRLIKKSHRLGLMFYLRVFPEMQTIWMI